MIRFFIFLIGAVICILQIQQPSLLAYYYQNSIVPSVTANFGNPYFNDPFKGFIVFLPDSQDPCSELTLEFDLDTIVFIPSTNLACSYAQVVYEIQLCGGGGVIFNSSSSNDQVQDKVISLPDEWSNDIEIFAVMVSYTSTFTWKFYGNNKIELAFSSTVNQNKIPDIYIELTGDHVLDLKFISDIYKYMMPLPIDDANIQIYFNYYTCKSCSAYDCYSNGKYCLNDSTSASPGKSMINQTLFEINLLNYVTLAKDTYADFFTYIKVISEYCKSDYSDSCSNYVLEWLGFDSEDIELMNNASWSTKNNAFSDNQILKSQMNDWKNNDLWFAPSITINEVKFLGGMKYFPQFFSDSFTDEPESSDGYCSGSCSLSMIDNGVCEPQCVKSACSLDIEDCKSFTSGCNNTLLYNSVCDKECNTTQYNYDNWACVCKCNSTLLNNGKCDSDCNTEICSYDYGDCTTTSQCNCTDDLLYNDKCDQECNTTECNYDNYECKNNTKDNDEDKNVSVTTSQIALIAGIIGGSFLLLVLGTIILCIIYRRSRNLSSPGNNDSGGESRNSSFNGNNGNNAENQEQNPYQQYAIRLPSRINSQQGVNSSPRIMQYPEILNSEVVASNEESEASKAEEVELGYKFYGEPICTICLEKVSKRKQEITKCLHIFHKKCLKEWVNKKGKASLCPNCNKNLS